MRGLLRFPSFDTPDPSASLGVWRLQMQAT